MTAPSFFTVINSYSIHLLLLIRQGRNPQQVGKKSEDTEMRVALRDSKISRQQAVEDIAGRYLNWVQVFTATK